MNITILLPEEADDTETDFSFIGDGYNVDRVKITLENYVDKVNKIPMENIIVNLCDGSKEENIVGIEVLELLEKQERKFIGTSSKNFSWTKSDIRKYDVSYAPYILINKHSDINYDNVKLNYPLFVKPNNATGGSIGVSLESKVHNAKELEKVVNESLKEYNEVIVEEYIDGTEFTILILQDKFNNPIVLEPIECIFSGGHTFKDYDLKWYDYKNLSYKPVADELLQATLCSFARDAFIKLKLDGYIRFDIRQNNKGELFLLDVNPYCAIFYPKELYGSADYILERSKILNHKTFVEHLIECSGNRYCVK